MDRGMAGVLAKAQRKGQSAGSAYAAITGQIAAFKGMPRAEFDRLWRETAAARPTGISRPNEEHRQWVDNLTGARQPVRRSVAAPARRPAAAVQRAARATAAARTYLTACAARDDPADRRPYAAKVAAVQAALRAYQAARRPSTYTP